MTFSLFGAFTMDVICSTGFGMDVDSQSNPDDPFVVNATKAMTANLVGPRILLACKQNASHKYYYNHTI
jgi:cytochrome P450 family 3 subfamily A